MTVHGLTVECNSGNSGSGVSGWHLPAACEAGARREAPEGQWDVAVGYGLLPMYRVSARVQKHDLRLVSSSQSKNNYFTEMCSGSEAGSYLRLIYFCITQL